MRAVEIFRPNSLEEAYQKWQENPKNALIAGGLWMKKMGQSYNTLIDLSTLELDSISEDNEYIKVGAMVTLRQFETSPIINSLFSGVTAFGIREVMGPAFRNTATIGGSIYGRYPFSDVIASLLPLDVKLICYPENQMTLEEFLQYKGKPNFIITHILIKKDSGRAYFKKVKTTALDFPILNISIAKRNEQYFIAVGSRPSVACLAHQAMEMKNNGASNEDVALKVLEELSFMDNTSASKEYRLDLAKVYVKRGLEEVSK